MCRARVAILLLALIGIGPSVVEVVRLGVPGPGQGELVLEFDAAERRALLDLAASDASWDEEVPGAIAWREPRRRPALARLIDEHWPRPDPEPIVVTWSYQVGRVLPLSEADSVESRGRIRLGPDSTAQTKWIDLGADALWLHWPGPGDLRPAHDPDRLIVEVQGARAVNGRWVETGWRDLESLPMDGCRGCRWIRLRFTFPGPAIAGWDPEPVYLDRFRLRFDYYGER